MSQFPRRQFLVAAGLLFLPVPYARVWAQSEGTIKLLRLPKVALVVGNGKYREGPLRNPANDARAIGEALKQTGFEVTLKLDATRVEMATAIQAYTQALAAGKGVGLFYYAGHGVQLQWKNYMLPVDAEIDTIDDVQRRAVEVNSLIEGLTRAANPLNVIILDACRDNPFGTATQPQQKGLSQMDAPTNTILAYATSPGNVASDGDGANGLYTENLLREIRVPEAKIEEVFKRVRLGVRRKSNGQQIPWESTSLEDDFYFRPPAQIRKLSDAEKARLFNEELTLWERIKESKEAGPFEDYLRRYPSGQFTELAQFQLDRALAKQGETRVEHASSEGSPFTKGSATANTSYKVGDSYSYRVLDYFSKVERSRVTDTVVRISENEVIFDSGLITDLLGNNLRMRNGIRFTPNQTLPLEYSVGKRWATRFNITAPNGQTGSAAGEVRVAGRDMITVPAGTFDAFRIEIRTDGYGFGQPPSTHQINYWMAPGKVRLQIVREALQSRDRRPYLAERYELTSFKQS